MAKRVLTDRQVMNVRDSVMGAEDLSDISGLVAQLGTGAQPARAQAKPELALAGR
ncbi:MAG: hypothetical protein WDN48_05610 [Pseudolabrys sp.]